ncbi:MULTISPECIES: biotin carboxylase [unclassified Polaribacter]|uniref:biotin carboxylase n=1 Tax=unclassified Polaribacter TaxID=196858 RepID=UPI0011BDAE0C|nr:MULTISPECIES: biotin carboxylase [unclassified Polaribacter]TXD52114.1 biotin carboxylase [Polaribacter sp. IC063]TXD59968.1 biotin carboxylase [Polaribacter sp. IC066]
MITKKTIQTKKVAVTKKDNSIDVLDGVPDIRRFFYKNEVPLYFISATNFNMLGADEWIKGFKFICHIECFDGLHPNVFSPNEEIPHDEFTCIEDINNYLLQHPEVQNYLKTRAKGKNVGKAMFLMFDEQTEKLAKKLGLEIMFPSAKMRTFMDNKVNTNRIAEKAGVPCVPYVLSQVIDFKHLNKVSKALGTDLVIQTPFGDSGHTTFFISNEKEFKKYEKEIVKEKEVKIMKRINCRGSAIEACVTRHGTIVAPLMTELVGFKEMTPYKGGWCGNEIYPDAFSPELREKAANYTQLFGNQLREEGYKGYFELDFLIDQDNGEIYLGELNPRVTGASSITNHAVFALADAPLFIFHIMEWMNVDYKLDVKAINNRWAKQANIDSWSQLIIKHTEETVEYISEAPKSGIYKMFDNGHIQFDRLDTHRRAVETENEAFFLHISKKGDYLYEGADIGILVSRGRMMSDDFELNERAKQWIKAIRGKYASEIVEDHKEQVLLSGSLTK